MKKFALAAVAAGLALSVAGTAYAADTFYVMFDKTKKECDCAN